MSKRREVVLGVKALVAAALPLARVRGFDREARKPQHGDAGGDVIGQPGEPGEPEVDLCPPVYHYTHSIPMEVAPPLGSPDPDAAIDGMMGAIGFAVAADRTLGGLCSHLEAEAPDVADSAVDGAESTRWARLTIVAHYSTEDPLN